MGKRFSRGWISTRASRLALATGTLATLVGGVRCGDAGTEPIDEPIVEFDYALADVRWKDYIDRNGDGYTSYRKLVFNVDLTNPDAEATIFLQVNYKAAGEATYQTLLETAPTTVKGRAENDAIEAAINLNDAAAFATGEYDFEIVVKEPNVREPKLSAGPENAAALDDEKFQNASLDAQGDRVSYWIAGARWEDEYDDDLDGAWSYAALRFDANVSGGLNSAYAKVYYADSTGAGYSLYKTTSTFLLADSSTRDAAKVEIGYPHSEIPAGVYAFKIELYDFADNALQATIDSSDDADLANVRVEPTAFDEARYTVASSWWANVEDADRDGLSGYRELHFDVDCDVEAEKLVYAEIYVKSGGSNESDYELYSVTSNFTVTGETATDAVWISVGEPNAELPFGAHDFLVEIYDVERGFYRTDYGPEQDVDMYAEGFEPTPEQQITYVGWTNAIDDDGDGYDQSRYLEVDVAIAASSARSAISVFVNEEGSFYYDLYAETSFKRIYSTSFSPIFSILVGAGASELPLGLYNFEIRAYDYETGYVADVLGPEFAAALYRERFETPAEDGLSFGIGGVRWEAKQDADGDGYASYNRLVYSASISSGSVEVYAELFVRGEGGDYESYATSSNFYVSSSGASQAFPVGSPNDELPHGRYDFAIQLYLVSTDELVAVIDDGDDSSLEGERFETTAEDN